MANSKEATVVIFDVSCQPAIQDGAKQPAAEDFHSKAKQCISRILQRKIFSTPHDEVGMLLMGTALAENRLRTAHGGYGHICEAFDLQCTNWHMLRVLENEIERGQCAADWLDAIVVALDMLNSHSAKKIKTFKIVLISTFEKPVDAESYATVVEQLQAMQIEIVVITESHHYDSESMQLRMTQNASAAEKHSKQIMTQLVRETDGVICDFDEALVQLIYFEKKKQKTMGWNAQLEIGSQLKINITAYIQIKDTPVLSWKYQDQRRVKYYLADKELSVDAQIDLIKGFRYGNEAIPYDSSLSAYGGQTTKCLSCIGFVKESVFQDQFFAGTGAWTVVAQKGVAASERKLVALVAALKELKRAVIVRYVYRNGTRPKVMALMPVNCPTDAYRNGASLTMLELIYRENLTTLLIPSLSSRKTEPSAEQLAAVDKLIDAMDLMNAQVNDDEDGNEGKATEAFKWNKLLNPTAQYMYRVISHRALHPGQPIPIIESDLKEKIQPPPKLKAAAAEPLQQLAKLFPLESVPKASSDMLFAKLKQISRSAAKQPSLSTAAGDDDANANPGTDANAKLVSVGTVTPDEDFAELLRRGERFSDVCAQMGDVIVALVLKTVLVPREKIGRAVMLFREEAKLLGPHRYNDFIETFKGMLVARKRTDFWEDVVVGERFGLITSAESELSAVSEQQADEFYKMDGAGGLAPKVEENADDGDVSGLLDDM